MKTILTGSCQINNPAFNLCYNLHVVYTVFFMPAFFVLTGYCSNFTRTFDQFLLSNLRTIFVPMVVLNLIPCLLSFNVSALKYMVDGANWLWGLSFWFLPALLLTKLFYWPIAHYVTNNILSWTLCILCFLLAYLFEEYHIGTSYWYWKSALAFVLYMHIGSKLRNSKWRSYILKIGAIVYLVTSPLLFYVCDFKWPMIGLTVGFGLENLLPFLIASISGCLGIMYISTLINNNYVLEYVGRASLVIYCSHWFIAQHLCKYLNLFFVPDNSVKAIIFYVVSTFLAIGFCCLLYRIYNTNYLSWIVGKKRSIYN